jgi:hypothetical protein
MLELPESVVVEPLGQGEQTRLPAKAEKEPTAQRTHTIALVMA